ncbi:MAG: sulfatase-like hydrolase/transferase, partial [Gammaproteobacteria bacterium]|nr:sulfatase-like hydrolase/transferase [Gammaproteobacteria bacterium]
RFVLFRPTLLHNHQYRHPIQPDTEYASSINARRYEYQAPNGTNRYAYFLKRQRDLEPERAQQIERHIYSRQLSYADAQLGRVFKVLQERYNDNSIVVLYANHGTGLGDNGIFKHGVAYQSCVHVPILILHPKISITVRVPSAVALADLAPAIYKMLEIPWATPISNDHLFDVLSGRNTEEKVLIGKNNWDEYIRIGPWKLIVRYGRFKLLFNIKSDPHESIDLYLKEPIIANRLEATLLNHKIKYARH